MGVTISGVDRNSPADSAGFTTGDILLSIDGHDIIDVLDYRFHMTNEHLVCEGTTAGGVLFSRRIDKGEYDDLGLRFDTYLMDKQRSCKNKCVFCFVDQLPQGLRKSLYFKDDDSRMSFLFGNYVTLTNLEERDIERILAMHISPVNISVHTMNPALRVDMMKNPSAGRVLAYIPRLAAGGIKINAQLVLCPGVNDGDELEYSLDQLCALAPALQSVAIVPVGLTKYRENLPLLRLFTAGEAAAVLDTVDRWGDRMRERHGCRICYGADEFYLAAGRPLPPAEFYGDFDQLENGVGLLALLQDEFAAALDCESPLPLRRSIAVATGTAAAPFLQKMAEQASRRFMGLEIQVFPIMNNFFGPDITVAGLITGRDIVCQLYNMYLYEELLIPAVMLRHEGDLFLDGMSIQELEEGLGIPVRPVPNDGYELLAAMLGRQI